MRTVENIIKHKLLDSGITQTRMAESFDVSVAYLSAMITGRNNLPFKWLKKIVEFLDFQADEAEGLFQAYLAEGHPIPWELLPDGEKEILATQAGTAVARAWWQSMKGIEDGQN
jgi:DNA-binding helix-turn-helix protein